MFSAASYPARMCGQPANVPVNPTVPHKNVWRVEVPFQGSATPGQAMARYNAASPAGAWQGQGETTGGRSAAPGSNGHGVLVRSPGFQAFVSADSVGP
jgi:hypothetical protein